MSNRTNEIDLFRKTLRQFTLFLYLHVVWEQKEPIDWHWECMLCIKCNGLRTTHYIHMETCPYTLTTQKFSAGFGNSMADEELTVWKMRYFDMWLWQIYMPLVNSHTFALQIFACHLAVDMPKQSAIQIWSRALFFSHPLPLLTFDNHHSDLCHNISHSRLWNSKMQKLFHKFIAKNAY